MITGSYR